MTKVQKAYEYARPLIDTMLAREARRMERLTDKQFGIVAERWLLPNGVSVMIYASRTYREMFIEATPGVNSWDATWAALDAAAKVGVDHGN